MGRPLRALLGFLCAAFILLSPAPAAYLPGSVGSNKNTLTAVAAPNSTVVLPANSYIQQIIILNTTGNIVLGGIKIGTTSGAVDVVAAVAVGANATVTVTDALLLKRYFSATNPQTLFIDAVTGFNSASLTIVIVWGQL